MGWRSPSGISSGRENATLCDEVLPLINFSCEKKELLL
jgi:hypothetical protein